jgi:hypothetical protein
MANYIPVCMDGVAIDGRRSSSTQVARERIAAQRWPIYKKTHGRSKFNAGDRIIVYVGGNVGQAQQFIVTGRILVNEALKNIFTGSNGDAAPEAIGAACRRLAGPHGAE